MIVPVSILTRAVLAAALLCTACDRLEDETVQVSVIGAPAEIAAPLTHVSSTAGRVSLAATAQGLVTYDAEGNVMPGLAQRWILVDDGKSYIFRLRRAQWTNDGAVKAPEVRRLLRHRLRAAQKADPYGSLASISEIIAMTDDVLEIRLATARPNFLVALAQPALGIAQDSGGGGPYRKTKQAGGELLLRPVDNLKDPEELEQKSDLRLLRAERAAKAVARFANDETDLVLGGTLTDLPYVTLAEVDDRSVRFDPVQGLFGLALSDRNPMFDDPNVREALAMAVEREAIVGYFNISRWKIADRIMPQQFNLPHPPTGPAWSRMPMAERRNRAAGVIARWRAQHGGAAVTLKVAMPAGPGMDLLFLALKEQYRRIGVGLERAERNADLTLIDEVAPYDSAFWYLGRLSCARNVHCNKEAEDLLKVSVTVQNITDRLQLVGEAEPLMQAHNGFIALATPVRWSLVAPHLRAFAPSPRAEHSLLWLLR